MRLTTSSLSLCELRSMMNELWEIQKEGYKCDWKHFGTNDGDKSKYLNKLEKYGNKHDLLIFPRDLTPSEMIIQADDLLGDLEHTVRLAEKERRNIIRYRVGIALQFVLGLAAISVPLVIALI